MYIKKNTMTVILCFLGAAVIVAAGAIVKANKGMTDVKQIAAYSYQQSFAELAEELDGISDDLQKSIHASSPYQSMNLAASVWKHAGAAKTSLEELPTDALNLQQIPKFLNQSGEYVLSVAKNMINGGEMSEEEKKNVKILYEQAKSLSQQMTELQYRVSSENLKYNDLLDFISLDDRNSEDSAMTSAAEGEKEKFISKNPIINMESGLKFPELNYDGAYSSHLLNVRSVFLQDKEPITDEEAKNRAAYIMDCAPSSLTQGEDITLGDVKCMTFDGKNSYIAVTMRQGYPLFFSKTREIQDAELTFDEAIKKGKEFLSKIKMSNMECVFYSEEGNVLNAEYVYVKNDVYCYPDKILLSVALDNGQIIGLDASKYLVSHSAKRALVPSLTEEAAAKKVTAITPENQRLCLLPTNGVEEREKLCYEFSGKDAYGEATVYVYINAHTGVEEDIRIMYDTEEGNVIK